MTELSLLLPTGSSGTAIGHTSRRATALLQEALHDSRRATFTREFGEIRGIHRLSAPSAASELADDGAVAEFVSPVTKPASVEARLGRSIPDKWQEALLKARGGEAAGDLNRGDSVAISTQHADSQLRSLIHDFKERQRKAGLVVAGSIASAIALTIATITLVFAIAA